MGSRLQKVLAEGHNKLQVYGRLKALQRNDVVRLLRKMMSDGLICDKLKLLKNDQIRCYVRLGHKANDFCGSESSFFGFPISGEASWSEVLEEVPQFGKKLNVHHQNIWPALPVELRRGLDLLSAYFRKTSELATDEAEKHKANLPKYDECCQMFIEASKKYKQILEEQKMKIDDSGLFDDLDDDRGLFDDLDENGDPNQTIDFKTVQRADRPSFISFGLNEAGADNSKGKRPCALNSSCSTKKMTKARKRSKVNLVSRKMPGNQRRVVLACKSSLLVFRSSSHLVHANNLQSSLFFSLFFLSAGNLKCDTKFQSKIVDFSRQP